MAILTAIGQWLLKIFLGGLFNKVLTQAEDEGQHKQDAGVLVAQSESDAAKTEIAIVKDEVAAKEKIEASKPTLENPFRNDEWNDEAK